MGTQTLILHDDSNPPPPTASDDSPDTTRASSCFFRVVVDILDAAEYGNDLTLSALERTLTGNGEHLGSPTHPCPSRVGGVQRDSF